MFITPGEKNAMKGPTALLTEGDIRGHICLHSLLSQRPRSRSCCITNLPVSKTLRSPYHCSPNYWPTFFFWMEIIAWNSYMSNSNVTLQLTTALMYNMEDTQYLIYEPSPLHSFGKRRSGPLTELQGFFPPPFLAPDGAWVPCHYHLWLA